MRSIRAKIITLMISACIELMAIVLIISYVVNKDNIVELCENYLYDTCVSASNTLYESFYEDEDNENIQVRLQYILYNVGISTMESSRAYLVDSNGNYLYHEDTDMLGTRIKDNPVIEEVLAELQNGKITTADVRSCKSGDKEIYVAFMCTVDNWVVFVQADKADVFAPVNEIIGILIICAIVLLIITVAVGTFFANKIARPVTLLTKVINDISEFNLCSDVKVPKTKDEIGDMRNATKHMRDNLADIVGSLENIARKLLSDANTLYIVSEKVNEASVDNSATNQELAASMESTSSATENVTQSIISMQENANNVATKIGNGTELTTSIMRRAEDINARTKKASDSTFELYKKMKETSEDAIQKAQEISKINELAKAIQDIADQTQLLSLNASIEAARAGEHGKGFAVVASDISSLAQQSTKTGEDIENIVAKVNQSVSKLEQCLREALAFLEKNVMDDYNDFMQSSNDYIAAAGNIEDFMNQANREVLELRAFIDDISTTVKGINDNVTQCSSGITDIAVKTTEIVEQTVETFEKTANCKEFAEQLENITSRFIIEK